MKKCYLLLLAVLLLVSLAGCAKETDKPIPETTQNHPTYQDTQIQNTETETEPVTEAAEKVVRVVSNQYNNSDATSYLIVQGLDAADNEVWSYRTADCAQTELETVQMFAQTDTAVYINEQGVQKGDNMNYGYMTALDMQTGEILWRNENCRGASVRACFDEYGTLYYCGYYGPDCTAIDTEGRLLWSVDTVDASCWWPYHIDYDSGLLSIFYEGTESGETEYRMLKLDGTIYTGN